MLGVLLGALHHPGNFSGVHSKKFAMLFYVNNDDRLCFFYAACSFHFFHSSFILFRYFALQITISYSSNKIFTSGKGNTKLK